MSESSEFDLNEQLQRWREELAQSPAFSGENLNELESHLRDSIATLQRCGLDAEEAYLIATKRLGKDAVLEAEFSRIHPGQVWLERAFWMLLGIQIWAFTTQVCGSISRSVLIWGWPAVHYDFKKGGLSLPVVLFTVVQILVFLVSLIVCWWLIFRKGRSLGSRLTARLHRRSSLIWTGLGLALLWLAIFSLSGVLQGLLAGQLRAERATLESTALLTSFSYANLIFWPVQMLALVFLTLEIARRRFGASNSGRTPAGHAR